MRMSRMTLIALVFLLSSCITDIVMGYTKATWASVNQSLVAVFNKDGINGSGVLLKNGYILSAAHCFHKKGVWVTMNPFESWEKNDRKNHPKAEVVKIEEDDPIDLMLLKDERFQGPTVEFADAVLDEEVIMVGYSMGEKHIHHGRVSRVTQKWVFLDINATFGASGSGVYNMDGKLIGIMDFLKCDALGYKCQAGLVPTKTIKEFLHDVKL